MKVGNKVNQNYFSSSRMIFLNKSAKENPSSEKNNKIYDGIAKTVEKSYREQLLLADSLNKQVEPIKKEKTQFENILKEMKETLAQSNYEKPIERNVTMFGEKVHIVMDENGTNQEFVNGKEVNFMQWAMSKIQKSE